MGLHRVGHDWHDLAAAAAVQDGKNIKGIQEENLEQKSLYVYIIHVKEFEHREAGMAFNQENCPK